MSLGKAIQFKHLLSQLTSSETQQFLNQLPIEIINTALFQCFTKPSNNHHVEATNNSLTNIIRSRKKTPLIITTQNKKINELPKPLIGIIASFMKQKDYINFSKSNRFIFLGCNTPNMLQELDVCHLKNYSCINLELFQSVKSLWFCLDKFHEFKTPSTHGITIMNNLRRISLVGDDLSDINIDAFMKQNWINTNNITSLQLIRFGNQNPFIDNSDTFHKLLSKFPNIEYCMFGVARIDIDAKRFKMCCPNLKGMRLVHTGPNLTQSLIYAFGSNLRFFEFDLHLNDYNLSNINFTQLQELGLRSATQKSLTDIFKTAVNVKKLVIFGTNKIQNEQYKESIIKIITTCKHLEYIEFCVHDKVFESILYGIEKGLFNTTKRKRKTFKIQIFAPPKIDPQFLIP
eukprot:541864_1